MTELATLIKKLAGSETLRRSGEEATRQAAVLPVLAELGWNWQDLDEVAPEHAVGSGRVDYCLRHANQSLVFVEVKRTGAELLQHQKQLLGYAFEEGVPLAALTDGLIWWLYLPTEPGSWEQRKFFTVDCRVQTPENAATALNRYLQREAVIDRSAIERATEELKGQQREQRIRAVLPTAWNKLLTEPDDLLQELVAVAVEGASGHRPDAEVVAEFLLQASVPASQLRIGKKRPAASGTVSVVKRRRPKGVKGQKPVAFLLDGQRHEVSTWRQVLVGTCNLLAAEASGSFVQKVLSIRGTKRSYFTTDAESLVRPLELKSGLFVEGNLSANDCVRVTSRVVRAIRGTDEAFDVEVAS
ncbi:MAG: restriction endonuclease subunit R [Chloroflexi bacterium]|nr:restriction endonuclease subunit R [Chloroflexota bacterium]